MAKKDRTNLYVTLFVISILVLVGIYTIISVSTTFTDIPKEIETNIPIMQPTPLLVCTITALLFCILLYPRVQNIIFKKEEE